MKNKNYLNYRIKTIAPTAPGSSDNTVNLPEAISPYYQGEVALFFGGSDTTVPFCFQ